jgi:PAS domain S-box-containing protein
MNKTTVLIVEDEAIVAADLAGKLGQLAYEVVGTAAAGEEAVELACRLLPRVVLMDIWLKGSMDGIEAAEAIRRRIDVPVIYLTAHSDSATLTRAKLTEPFGYILKPFEERELATTIEMALYKHQSDRQLREQREWLRITLNSIGDAVITCDNDSRVTFLNPVAEALTGWTTEEAKQRPIQEVFRLINEQTRKPPEDPVALVLREGRPTAMVNHTALVTRDGREIPIEDSASPILDADGRVIGAVLVFHDVTEKRRAEDALRKSHEELEMRVEARTSELRAASLYTRGLIEASLDPLVTISPEGKITDVNYATEQATGLRRDQLIGSDFSDYFTDPDSAREGYRKVLADGQVRDYPLSMHHASADTTDVLYNATVYRNERGEIQGVFAAARDVTDHNRAEEAVKAERRRLYDVLETLPVYVILLTSDYHVPFANRFFRERFGESGGRRCYEYLFNRSEPCEICETFGVMKTNEPHHWYWTGPDGRDYDIYDYPFIDSDGSMLILEMGIDITEQKQAQQALTEMNDTLEERIIERTAQLNSANESLRASRVAALNLMEDAVAARKQAEETNEELRREIAVRKRAEARLLQLNRALTARNRCSLALRDTLDEAAYLEQLCRIIVDDCGHAMVWVGYAEQDESKSIRPVASAGFDQGYLETLGISWADTERGRGPTGTAIRTGRSAACNNMMTDPQFAPWRQEALQRGYCSSLVLPLLAEGKAFGAITIYAKEPGAFSEEEVDSLSKLAGDTSDAIMTIRLRQAHQQAEETLRRYELLAGHSRDIILFMRRDDGRILEANAAACVSYGYTREEMLTRTVHDLRSHEDHQLISKQMTAADVDGLQFETVHRRRDGSEFPVEVSSQGATIGGTRTLISVIRDITERKRAEEELNHANQRLDLMASTAGRLLMSDSPQRVVDDLCKKVMAFLDCHTFFNFLVDDQTGRLHLNACAGIPEEEVKRIEWLDYGAAVCGCAAQDACRIVAENIPYTLDPRTELIKSYGVKAYACHPLLAQGRVLGTLSFGTRSRTRFTADELSLMKAVADHVAIAMERKRAEEALKKAHDELETKVEERTAEIREMDQILLQQSRQAAMGEMIGNIAHQWRQPLNTLGLLIGMLPMMQEAGELTTEQLESMEEKAMGIIQHMSQTINDFSNYFKPDKEKIMFRAGDAVTKTLTLIEDSFRNREIAIEVQATDDPLINGYPNEFSQVLLNILLNARDAFTERRVREPKVVINTSTENGRAVVTVSDNAGGIPENIIDKIFDPYFTTKGPEHGTGVGLFMSKGIIEKNMGGLLSARNTYNGAEFRIEV